jgi:hypothetical protein
MSRSTSCRTEGSGLKGSTRTVQTGAEAIRAILGRRDSRACEQQRQRDDSFHCFLPPHDGERQQITRGRCGPGLSPCSSTPGGDLAPPMGLHHEADVNLGPERLAKGAETSVY